jgi:hypothetical protein
VKVIENRAPRRIFISKRDDMAGCWREQHNEELYKLHSPPNIILMITSKRMRTSGHAARTGRRILLKSLKEKSTRKVQTQVGVKVFGREPQMYKMKTYIY